MIAEDVKRRIWIGVLVGTVIIGALFLIWAVFLNRGTIILHSRAPYSVNILNLRTENCPANDCTIIVAPGDYSITVQKDGYKPLTQTITVPLGKPYENNIDLQFIPVIRQTSQAANNSKSILFPPDNQLTKPELAQLNQMGIGNRIQLFFDNQQKIICYIVRNPDNQRQVMYLITINPDGKISTPQIVTTFLRDIQDYVIAPSDDGNKIAVIDRAAPEATLYIVDRQAQNRTSLLNYPTIRDMRWISGTSDFIFQAREQADGPESLYLYRWDEGKTLKLGLNTSLQNVAIINKDRMFAVTDQQLPTDTTPDALQGQLVTLGENQSTLEVNGNPVLTPQPTDQSLSTLSLSTTTPVIATPTYSFIDYSLSANDARLIITITTDPFPSRIKASADAKSLYFLQGDNVFELRLEE